MKTISQHIEHVRAQPHHVRKHVAFASAAAITIVVALVWFASSISAGVFALRVDSSFGQSAGSLKEVSSNQNLAGVGAAAAFSQVDTVPAHIEIIDSAPAASGVKKAEQTTIPF